MCIEDVFLEDAIITMRVSLLNSSNDYLTGSVKKLLSSSLVSQREPFVGQPVVPAQTFFVVVMCSCDGDRFMLFYRVTASKFGIQYFQ